MDETTPRNPAPPREAPGGRLGRRQTAPGLNGKEIVRFVRDRALEKDENLSEPVRLERGWNVLGMAVINGSGECGAYARFLGADSCPVRSFRVAPAPDNGFR